MVRSLSQPKIRHAQAGIGVHIVRHTISCSEQTNSLYSAISLSILERHERSSDTSSSLVCCDGSAIRPDSRVWSLNTFRLCVHVLGVYAGWPSPSLLCVHPSVKLEWKQQIRVPKMMVRGDERCVPSRREGLEAFIRTSRLRG